MNMCVVIPVIDKEFSKDCIESILNENSSAGIDKEDILIVDNTREGLGEYYGLEIYRDPGGHNIGVPRAWNIGARRVLERGLDYLVIMSASMYFGPVLHCTWVSQMKTFWGKNVIECEGHSWHLIAFHRRILEQVGLFDENFYPGYFEAIDYGYRMRMLGLEGGWDHVWVNAISRAVGRHSELVLATPLLEYYADKWGGGKGNETFKLPYGKFPIDYFFALPIHVLAQKYNLTNWY